MNTTIQGLWIGPELSAMEKLSIASFLQNGHAYHLYVYSDLRNLPPGTELKDANEILPSSRIFQYKQKPSYAGFANFFRYKLLLERGGWWADTDMICLKAFDFPESHVFASEICDGEEVVTSGIIKAPIGSEAMAYAWEVCQSKDLDKLIWGETGPRLMAQAAKMFALEQHQKPHHVFCPLAYTDWHKVLEPEAGELVSESSYALHLWNEMWRVNNQDKSGAYHPDCLYERLKRKYLRFLKAEQPGC